MESDVGVSSSQWTLDLPGSEYEDVLIANKEHGSDEVIAWFLRR